MYINKINLTNFRNYEEQEVILDKNINIFYGNNAQGKTNLLEAIYLCAIGKSYRTNRDKELVKEFIDLTFSEYKSSEQYPAPTFGFVWTYRQGDLQRAQINIRKQQSTEQASEEIQSDSLDDWLLS